MKNKDAKEIAAKEYQVVNHPGLSFGPFVPTVDGDVINSEPKQLLSGFLNKFKDIPVLLGTNADEGSKTAMNSLPNFFPNVEMNQPKLKYEEFEEIVEDIFSTYPQGVCFLYSIDYYL